MATELDALKERLLQTDDEFRQLSAKHQELESRLHELSVKPYLSDSEQFESVTMKKRKLQLKDRMEDILRRHRTASTSAAMISPSPSPASQG